VFFARTKSKRVGWLNAWRFDATSFRSARKIFMQPILKINLTTGKTEEYKIPEQWEKDFLGGASLAARICSLHPALSGR
jgi:hypothetical protein